MRIGEVAEHTGLPPKTIRYYEEIGLVRAATRAENGYRAYDPRDVELLRFVNRARRLGFSVADCRALIGLYTDRNRASADVKALTLEHIADIDRKIAEFQAMRETLSKLAEACHGDDRPDCPILENLANSAP